MAIPKKIHYCWFGGNPKPELAIKCLKSWKKYCPDFEIIEWNESNFDVNANQYCRDAYKEKKWAFVTDYARLAILHEHGGVYFDTDVQLIRPIDDLLEHPAFMGIEWVSDCKKVNTGLGLGSEPGNPLIKEIMDDYANSSFYKDDGSIDITTCTVRNTEILKRHGYVEEDRIQRIPNAVIYSTEYFCPMDMTNGRMHKTKNTYSIHHYSLSWTSKEHQEERKVYLRKARRADFFYNLKVLPNNILQKLLGKDRYARWIQKLKKGSGK